MQQRSSLLYQILLYCNGWYFGLFVVAELLLFVYKAQILPYPKHNLAAEIILLLLTAGVEAIRNFFGQKGNLTTQVYPVTISMALSVPIVCSTLYYLLWQTYVLRLELILAAFQLLFVALEMIFGVVAVASFS